MNDHSTFPEDELYEQSSTPPTKDCIAEAEKTLDVIRWQDMDRCTQQIAGQLISLLAHARQLEKEVEALSKTGGCVRMSHARHFELLDQILKGAKNYVAATQRIVELERITKVQDAAILEQIKEKDELEKQRDEAIADQKVCVDAVAKRTTELTEEMVKHNELRAMLDGAVKGWAIFDADGKLDYDEDWPNRMYHVDNEREARKMYRIDLNESYGPILVLPAPAAEGSGNV